MLIMIFFSFSVKNQRTRRCTGFRERYAPQGKCKTNQTIDWGRDAGLTAHVIGQIIPTESGSTGIVL